MALTKKAKILCEYKSLHPLLTQQQLADNLGFDVKTVVKWVNNEEFLDYEHELCMKIFKGAQGIVFGSATIAVQSPAEKPI